MISRYTADMNSLSYCVWGHLRRSLEYGSRVCFNSQGFHKHAEFFGMQSRCHGTINSFEHRTFPVTPSLAKQHVRPNNSIVQSTNLYPRQLCSNSGSSSGVKDENIHCTLDEAVRITEGRLKGKSEKNLFVGNGQYFQHSSDERLVILNSSLPLYGASDEDAIEMETVLDCSVSCSQSTILSTSLASSSDSPVGVGEVDFIDKGKWEWGFCFQPAFSIFAEGGKVLATFTDTLETEKKSFVRVYLFGLHEDIPVDKVTSIRVKVLEEPFAHQVLEIELDDGEIVTVLEKVVSENNDLSLLMVETEWLVKCAGLLCLDLRRKGSSDIRLQLPENLTIAGNPWVEMRHQAWVKSLSSDENK